RAGGDGGRGRGQLGGGLRSGHAGRTRSPRHGRALTGGGGRSRGRWRSGRGPYFRGGEEARHLAAVVVVQQGEIVGHAVPHDRGAAHIDVAGGVMPGTRVHVHARSRGQG